MSKLYVEVAGLKGLVHVRKVYAGNGKYKSVTSKVPFGNATNPWDVASATQKKVWTTMSEHAKKRLTGNLKAGEKSIVDRALSEKENLRDAIYAIPGIKKHKEIK